MKDTDDSFPEAGPVRLSQILNYVPVSRSLWWQGVRDGRFPKPCRKISARVTCWWAEDVRALFHDNLDGGNQ